MSVAVVHTAEGSLPGVPDLDLSYGGRRHFCGQAYVDHGIVAVHACACH